MRRPLASVALAAGLVLAALALVPACGSAAGAVPADTARGELTDDLFPFTAREATYALSRGGERRMVVAPDGDAAVLTVGEGAGARRLDVRREATGIVFSAGPNAAAELIRVGAAPGAEWTSGATSLRFDGWERISVPAGTWDVARIRAVSGPSSLPTVETWWFAAGVGVVRLRSDRGGIFSDEMSLAR